MLFRSMIAGAGLVIYILAGILRQIQGIKVYALIARPIAGFAIMVGMFMTGGSGVIAMYQEQAKVAEAKQAMAEKQSAKLNEQLSTALKDKETLLKGKSNALKQTIESHRVDIDAACKLNDTAWLLYNQSIGSDQSKVASGVGGTNGASPKPQTPAGR